MTRRLLALCLSGALFTAGFLAVGALNPTPVMAQEDGTEEDPEPEVSLDARLWDRPLAFHVTGGLDTPFGVAGAAVEFSPIRWIAIYAGGGVARSGARVAGGVHVRAPIGHGALGLMGGVGGGPLDWSSRTNGEGAPSTQRWWEFALHVHAGLTLEYRWEMGLFGRLAFGIDTLATPGTADVCTLSTGEECGAAGEGLVNPLRGWIGLNIGFAPEL